MRIRTVDNLEALKRLAEDEIISVPAAQDPVSSTLDALQSHLKQPAAPRSDKKRNVALETAVELLRLENQERTSSEEQARQTERHFQQLFSASRLPIAVYDLSSVLLFLHNLTPEASSAGLAQFVGARPDLSGQLLQRLNPMMRNDALQKHLTAQSLADDESLLDHLSIRSIESFVEALLALASKSDADSECHISLDFDNATHHYHLAIIPLAGHEHALDRVLMIFTPISVTHLQRQSKVDSLGVIKSRLYADSQKSDAILVFDGSGHIQEVSDGAARILGFTAEGNRRIDDLFVSSEDIQRFERVQSESRRQPHQLVESQQQMECACQDGRRVWITYSICCIGDNDTFVLVLNDVSASHRLLEHIRFQNTRDVLTNLYNRREFKKYLAQALDNVSAERSHAMLLIDLDFFKIINDGYGHAAGDEFLRQVGELLTRSVRVNDIVARLGGDEFGILLKNCRSDIARRIAEGIANDIAQHKFLWNQHPLPLTASVAIVPVDAQIASAEICLAHADAAVYAAKEAGGNRCQLYDASHELVARHQSQLHWFSRIHAALESNRFVLYAQKIDALSKQARQEGCHYELLIRMLGENGEIIPPGEFLPAAERYNLMPLIDRWVVRNAFQWIALNSGKRGAIGMCSINVSGASLCDEQFCDYVLKQFTDFRVAGNMICFEITETMAIQNLQKTLDFMSKMRGLGCKFSLDDFGAGFSSYGHLRTLPVDFVKIDGQFVKQMAYDPIDFAMVKSINELGHLMQRQTIAEFVEDEKTIETLKALGVDYAQGYGIERPERLPINADIQGRKKTG